MMQDVLHLTARNAVMCVNNRLLCSWCFLVVLSHQKYFVDTLILSRLSGPFQLIYRSSTRIYLLFEHFLYWLYEICKYVKKYMDIYECLR